MKINKRKKKFTPLRCSACNKIIEDETFYDLCRDCYYEAFPEELEITDEDLELIDEYVED